MRTDPRFEKWCRWLNVITDDVYNLNVDRDIFKNVIDIVKGNERIDKNSAFFGFFIKTYVYSVVMGIRRQLKTDNDSISLFGLLTEIAEHPELITRSHFYSLYDNKLDSLPKKAF
jgi:hypothetical protein